MEEITGCLRPSLEHFLYRLSVSSAAMTGSSDFSLARCASWVPPRAYASISTSASLFALGLCHGLEYVGHMALNPARLFWVSIFSFFPRTHLTSSSSRVLCPDPTPLRRWGLAPWILYMTCYFVLAYPLMIDISFMLALFTLLSFIPLYLTYHVVPHELHF